MNLQKNLANKLTAARAFLVIPFGFFLASENPYFMVASLALLLIAAATDFLDGKIARKRQEVSSLGKFLDPLADKLFICTALIIFLVKEPVYLPVWPVIVIICREFIINAFRSFASSKGIVVGAEKEGKIKTALQMTAVAVIIIFIIIDRWLGSVYPLLAIVSAYTVYSGAVYIKNNIDIITRSNKP